MSMTNFSSVCISSATRAFLKFQGDTYVYICSLQFFLFSLIKGTLKNKKQFFNEPRAGE